MSEDAQAVVPSFEIRPTDESDPNKWQNRCPIGIEREKLSQWAKRDQQELDRVSKEIKLNSEEIESCLLAICHYEEAILVAKLLRKCVEDKIQVAKKAFESIRISPEKHDQPPPLHDNRGTLALLNLLKMRNDTISAYNHEIKSLQSTIDHFAERTRNLEEDADATRSVLSVTRRRNETLELIKKTLTKDLSEKLELLSARRRTPDEIWRQIFLLRAVDDELDFELQERIGRPPFTSLRLSAVCQYWRRLVESQTDLWQCIARLNGNNTSSKPRLDHYLAKLGNRIPIVYTYMLKKDVTPCWAELSTIISQKIPKCKSLDLAIDIPQPMPRSFLSSLKLTTEELRLRHHRPGQETIFVYKQRMKEVWSISCYRIQLRLERNFSPDTSEPSPAGQELALETLTFTECALELDPLFEFCRQAPRLHHLDVRKSLILVAPDPAADGIIFSSLKKLSLRSSSLGAFNHKSLLPHLEEVDLTCMENAIADWREFLSIGRRDQKIQTITLRNESAIKPGITLQEVYQSILTSLVVVKHLTLFDNPTSSDNEQFPLTAVASACVAHLTLMDSHVKEEHLSEILEEAYSIRQQPIFMTFSRCKNIDSPAAGRLTCVEFVNSGSPPVF